MTDKKLSSVDVCFVIPSSAKKAYQKLADVYSAIEPPTWALLLAQSLRQKNYECVIFDFDADPKNIDQSVKAIADTKPKLVIFVLYGQNPNSGTTMMIGATELAEHLKNIGIDQELINTWIQICNTTDMAKYAKQIPDIGQYHEDKINIINLLKSFHAFKIQSASMI